MSTPCPLCHSGTLEQIEHLGERRIQCSQYPLCRFEAENWESVRLAAARFHHPVHHGK